MRFKGPGSGNGPTRPAAALFLDNLDGIGGGAPVHSFHQCVVVWPQLKEGSDSVAAATHNGWFVAQQCLKLLVRVIGEAVQAGLP